MTDTDFLFKLGSRIKHFRKEKGITQQELASLCDFEKASMSRIESGKTNVSILTLRKVSKALEIHISEFLKDNGK